LNNIQLTNFTKLLDELDA